MISTLCKKLLFFLFLFFTLCTFAQQQELVPLTFDAVLYNAYQNKPHQNLKTTATAATTDTITLPFLDDFSTTYTLIPDTSLWLDEDGGAYVNNRYPIYPPSRNVATFDGLMIDGTPYDFSTSQTVTTGLADFLTSKPIDLSGIDPADSLAFSFYWQKGGRLLNSFPDQVDSLRLQFLDTASNWVTQKAILGDTVITETSLESFYYEFFHITDEKYMHAGFQFRFQVFCYLKGNFDIYHIDYIQLDTARKIDDINVDVAYSSPLTSYLQPYTSVTKKQFFSDPSQYIADSVITFITNPSGSNFEFANINKENGYLRDTISNTTIEVMPTGINNLLFTGDTVKAFWLPSVDSITDNIPPLNVNDAMVLKYRFNMITQDSLEANDSIIGYNIIDNYMAYDDGSVEGAYVYGKSFNEYVVKYSLLEQDTLYYVQAMFPKLNIDVENKSIQWRIYKTLDGVDGATEDDLLYAKTVILTYTDDINGFTLDSMTYRQEFPFSEDEGVIIPAGDFYIGILQYSSDQIPIGFDINTNNGDKFYINDGSGWSNTFGLANELSIMIRPGFGTRKPFDLTPIDDSFKKELKFTVFPNPSNSSISINRPLDNVNIYDITGNLVLTAQTVDANTKIDISSLPAGLYLVEGQFDKYRAVKKVLKH